MMRFFECYFIIKTISRWFQLNTIFIRSFILLQVFCNFSDFFTKIFWALDCSTDYLLRIENAYYSICKLHSVAQETRSYLFLLQYHNKYFAMHLFYTNEPVAIVSIIAYKTVVSRITFLCIYMTCILSITFMHWNMHFTVYIFFCLCIICF